MIYGSVCSGIEAATMAWHPLGWSPAFLSEIEAFPSAVLAHHYPCVPNLGDMTKFEEWPEHAIDLLVGGTPCQSFSVAGLRQGLADPRGNLMLTYLAIARRYRPRWLVWENVPGVLSSNGGRDFGTFIRGLEECGYHAAWRVLDAQYVRVDGFERAVPQRRRRVFVVGYLGDWRRPAAVLFEPEGLRGDSAPRRQAGKGFAADVAPSIVSSGRGVERAGDTRGQDPVVAVHVDDAARCDTAGYAQRLDWETENFVAHTLKGEGFDASEDGTGRGTPIVPMTLAIRGRDGEPDIEWRQDGTSNAILTPNGGRAGMGVGAIAWSIMPQNSGKDYKARQVEVAQPVMAGGPVGGNQGGDYIQHAWAVRRLTPRECERLQGFPDGFTNIPWRNKPASPDGPRYKALGNSMAVNVMRWIGQRIEHVEALSAEAA
ncbi:DNA (cytosine-5-)-methyltransferase [Sinorhizobium fredii]|uniref:Cytosine-specific methyltransferase n=1 Tax=Rhizobium fredii TaxID=380 RepID=A0A2A6LYU4_RHIFR|nr:DNA cytosine methyltransferase [Sinorhizobium fredii]PDT47309.1 DNA (cytosine-5-)-methyltransferase [Sinorhizobium fredii]